MFDMEELDAQQLHGLLQERNGEQLILLDVRTPAEVNRGGIPGARHIPLHLLPAMRPELEDGAALVLYCHSGVRSAQGCAFLKSHGYSSVYNLRGGILGWAQSGRSLEPIESMDASA